MSRIETEQEARALARSILADVERFHGAELDSGAMPSAAVDEGRALYRERVAPELNPLFEAVLAETRLGAPPRQAAGAPRSTRAPWSRRRIAPFVSLALVGFVVLWGVRSCWTPGERVGSVVVPGSIHLDLRAGDELAFRADTDVDYARPVTDQPPAGCVLTIALVRDDGRQQTTSCDLFRTTPHANATGWERSQTLSNGKTRLTVTGQRLSCALKVATSGGATLRASSNVATCVPTAHKVEAHVFVDRPSK